MKTWAFSLVETAAALAISAFAIVGILGLIPIALQSARLSQEETRATLIARTIASGLAVCPLDQALIVTGTGPVPPTIRPNLTQATSRHAAYSASGQPLAEISENTFQSGIAAPAGTSYVARITAAPGGFHAGLVQLQITVEGPAQAPSGQRNRFVFITHACAL